MELIFKNAHQALREKGLLVFTIELGEKDAYKLCNTGRYVHHKDYLTKLAKQNKFNLLQVQDITGRMQSGKPVNGCLLILQK